MDNRTRKFLFLFFVFAFAIITPLVSLYAAGYKLSFSGKLLQKTGMLIIDSSPDGARIIINGKSRQNIVNKIKSKFFNSAKLQNILKTPAKIKGLMPGEYTIKLEKEGYWSWEKKLEIRPGNSTFAEDIVLFKNNLPQPISNGEIKNSKQSPNKKNIAFSTNKKYFVYNTENENLLFFTKNKQNLNSNKNNIIWLGNEKILFDDQLFSLSSWSKPEDISVSLKNIDSSNIQFKDAGSIYLQINNNITELNLKSKGIKTILNSQKIFDYLIKNNLIFTIEELNKEIYLVVYDNKKIIRKINLKYDNNYSFVNTDNDLINIYNKKFKTLYLVDPLDYFAPLKETINNVDNSFWVNNERLVYYNDYEIWIYDRANTKKTILTRISEKINNCLWHPSNNYIIYSTAESLFTIELDNREKHSTNRLIKLKNINFLDINNSGDTLYFNAEIGKQTGLFKLAI